VLILPCGVRCHRHHPFCGCVHVCIASSCIFHHMEDLDLVCFSLVSVLSVDIYQIVDSCYAWRICCGTGVPTIQKGSCRGISSLFHHLLTYFLFAVLCVLGFQCSSLGLFIVYQFNRCHNPGSFQIPMK